MQVNSMPDQALMHRSKHPMQKEIIRQLNTWGMEVIEVSVLAELKEFSIMESLPVALAIISDSEPEGIEFLRSVMHANNLIQRMMLTESQNAELFERAINKAHVNYLLKLPLDRDKLSVYLRKAWRRYDNLTRPFAKLNALASVTQDLLLENERFRMEANTDSLTKLMNRRSFNAMLERFWLSFLNNKMNFALAMIDIDHFKKVNDTYGHHAGDLILQNLSDIFLGNRRIGVDFAFRYGGEEFAILSTGATAEEMKKYVERLLQVVVSRPLKLDGTEIGVTFSAGISTAELCSSAEELITQADLALYQAKNNGRNQVRIFQP